jgi:2,3-bisphosphoglycerate-independent phosphoglycerate mutase
MKRKQAILIIMDGWGWREDADGNAVQIARTPNVDALWERYPHTLINGSGPYVGLPEGQMGNSEVGHLNLGAGRVVYQDIVRIDRAVADGSFFANETLAGALDAARSGALHLIGLLSDGGVHSHQSHLYALLRMARDRGLQRVFVHAILDGRDTPPHNGVKYLAALADQMRALGVGRVASGPGRYYAMDRDKRWERTVRAYDLLTRGEGARAHDARAAVEASYARGVTDEFVEPVVITGEGDDPVARVVDGDAIVFYNFRADRARQIAHAFTDDDFSSFARQVRPRVHYTCMTRYEDALPLPVAFPPVSRRHILADVAADAGLTSLRIAETEKYAHVTYFFNGGEETERPGEKRILVPSPKVATYDLQPEMSAHAVRDGLLGELAAGGPDYVVCNFANPDMVGHTGVLEAAVKACETVDDCVGRIVRSLDLERQMAIVTADHGNAEEMFDYVNGGPHTAHTTNPVPCMLVDPNYRGSLIEDGALKEIAPTMLHYMGIQVPHEMTGRDLRADLSP